MKAVILAGGFGTRLRPLTYTVPKPLVIAAGKPLLHYILSNLQKSGFEEAVITTNYLARIIREYVKKGEFRSFARVIKEKKPLGTAGAVRNVRKYLDGNFAVLQGDAITAIDAGKIAEKQRGAVSIALKPVRNANEYGIVELGSGGKIKRFCEKPKKHECFSNLVNTGIYILDYSVLDEIPEGIPFDFALDLFPKLLKKRKSIYGIITHDFWVDVGRVENYLAGNRWLMDEMKCRCIGERTSVRNARLIPPFCLGDEVRLKPGARVGPFAVIGNNCEIGKNAKISNSIIYDFVKIGRNSSLEGCVVCEKNELEEKVHVSENTIIGTGCIISANSKISQGSKIGPLLTVPPGAAVEGTLFPPLEKIEKLQKFMGKIPLPKGLARNERKIVRSLAKFGKMKENLLESLSRLPHNKLESALSHLEKLRVVKLDKEVLSLVYEDPSLIGRVLREKKKKSLDSRRKKNC